MEIVIERMHFPKGTNGALYVNGTFRCHSIELPWNNNHTRVSCIPDGSYPLAKRSSEKFGDHLILKNTAPRKLILIHPANNALKELQGCIAPVTTITGEGEGLGSKKAFNPILKEAYAALERGEEVSIVLKKKVMAGNLKVMTEGLNIRIGPERIFKSVGTLTLNTRVKLIDVHNDWSYVEVDEKLKGWVKSSFLQ